MYKAGLFLLALGACSTTQVVMRSSCREGDTVCERNLNAETLAAIGRPEAAERLMCMDPDIAMAMGDTCQE